VVKPGQAGAIHHMVGMQNVDGTVWYWVDASASQEAFDSAFEKCSDDFNASVPFIAFIRPFITQIDYLSLSQSHPDYLSTLLSFRSMFSLNVTPAFDVFDPQGLIQSQVVCNDDLSFQLAFNATDAQSTTSARFMQRAKRAGVQHIGLKTDDIYACAQSLRDAGIETLTIPPNYYPDVESRFGLEVGLVEKMATFNVLYDEDEIRIFFQFYTMPIDGKFSFEIVQRNGYKGLGSANAALHAAAQQYSMSTE
jgi:4-hydroxyphenylpyruvate dioxygenase